MFSFSYLGSSDQADKRDQSVMHMGKYEPDPDIKPVLMSFDLYPGRLKFSVHQSELKD